MKTEGTIFIFEWMFVLYGSFRIREPYTDELERLFRKGSLLNLVVFVVQTTGWTEY